MLARLVPALRKAADRGDSRLRAAVARCVGEVAVDPAEAAAVLGGLWGAARALGRMGPPGDLTAKAVAGLARVVSDDSADVRSTALAVLEGYGTRAAAAAPAVSALARDDDRDSPTRVQALNVLAAISPRAGKDTLAALVTALGAKDVRVRQAAARTLGKVGPLDRAAEDALRKALDDDDAAVRDAAAAALLKGGSPAADKPPGSPPPG